MSQISSTCPSCGIELAIPAGCQAKRAKCAACGAAFALAELLSDESAHTAEIADWLNDNSAAGALAPKQDNYTPHRQAQVQVPTRKMPTIVDGGGALSFQVRLKHVDEMGAFLLFDSSLLFQEEFRSKFPQKCITCGSTDELSIYTVEWHCSRTKKRADMKERTGYHMPSVFELDRFKEHSPIKLLSVLSKIEFIPEPYCLPFPYYVCKSCSPVGAIMTDIRPNNDTEGEMCELGIASVQQAYAFAVSACGERSTIAQEIEAALKNGGGGAWKRLPLAVRNRIKQWFTLASEEDFLAYIPDADFSKAEAGIAGVIVTDKKLVYHKSLSLIEFARDQKVSCEPKTVDGNRVKLKISIPGGKAATLSANKTTANQLKQIMTHWNSPRKTPSLRTT